METVGKFVVAIIGLIIVGTGFYYAIRYSSAQFGPNIALSSAAIEAAAPKAPVTISLTATTTAVTPLPATAGQLDVVGTIVYYVQQGVEVPYLFYSVHGAMYSKALEFSQESICATSVESPCPSSIDTFKYEYGSGPVRVVGTVDDESLIVSRISLAAQFGK